MNRTELITDIKINCSTELVELRQPYTVAKLRYGYCDRDYYGVGFSKVCHPDEWNPTTGSNLAFNRAVGDIYRQIKADEK